MPTSTLDFWNLFATSTAQMFSDLIPFWYIAVIFFVAFLFGTGLLYAIKIATK